jgi:hypothetical protein
VKCEQVFRGYIKGHGIRYLKTSCVDQILNGDSLKKILEQNVDSDKTLETKTSFPEENVLAVSFLRPITDDYGRKTVWNHTILIELNSFVEEAKPENLVSSLLLRNPDEVPEKLKALEVSVNG